RKGQPAAPAGRRRRRIGFWGCRHNGFPGISNLQSDGHLDGPGACGRFSNLSGMFMDQAESLISDYAVSEHFMFLNPKAKENFEAVLMAFFRKAAESGAATLDALKGRDVED